MKEKIKIVDILTAFKQGLINESQAEQKLFGLCVVVNCKIMEEKIERVIEHLEHLKVKETKLYNRLGKQGNNQVVSFGKIQGLNDAVRFIKSEFS